MLQIRVVGERSVRHGDWDDLDEVMDDPARDGFVWIDFMAPTPEESARLEELPLPELVVEDMREDRHLPKVETIDECLSLTVHGLDVASGDELRTVELDVALREDVLVTYRRDHVASLEALAERIDRRQLGFARPFLLLHRLLDVMNDVFVPFVEHFDLRLDVIEGDILDEPTEQTRRDIYGLQRDIIQLRRVVVPQAEVIRRLSRERPPGWQDGDAALVRDLYDHLNRMAGLSDSYRQLLDSAMDSYRSSLDDDLNEMLTTLTIISAVLLPVSVVAGLWGMNFVDIPGDGAPNGFWWTLAGCGGLILVMLLWFALKGWIGNGAERRARDRRSGMRTVLDVPLLGDVLKVPVAGGRAVRRFTRRRRGGTA